MAEQPPCITADLVRQLVDSQFPELATQPLTMVEPGGWDNRTFRLGDALSVRLPSSARYAPQIAREAVAFGALAGLLPAAIPERVHQGAPGQGYPFDWAINRWLPGNPAGRSQVESDFAAQCGRFLTCLHGIDASTQLAPGADNFHRGGLLANYADEVERAIVRLDDAVLAKALTERWQRALESVYSGPQCWIHGDFFPWNLLVDQAGRLSGVIDWGLTATGDPACDFALGWACFNQEQRQALREASGVDPATWYRARGWALWKSATLATGVNGGTAEDIAASRAVLARIKADEL